MSHIYDFFDKRLDNSRLVKAEDPVRKREMRSFAIAAVFFFALLMGYSWQHFSSIEYGYRIETEKAQLQHLQEENHQLGLTEAQLKQSERIDRLAHQIGMQSPQPGQIVTPGAMDSNAGTPVVAAMTVPVVPAVQLRRKIFSCCFTGCFPLFAGFSTRSAARNLALIDEYRPPRRPIRTRALR